MKQAGGVITDAEGREKRQRFLRIIGAGGFALIAILGASIAISNSHGVSRAERVAAKGGPGEGNRPGGPRGDRGEMGRRPDRKPGEGRGPGGGSFGQQREQRMAQMNATLGLTSEQQTRVKALGESLRPQMQALWQNKSLSEEEKRTQMRTLRTQMQTQMRQLLTPEQQAKFDAMQAQRQARRQQMQARREQTRAALIASGQTPPQRGQWRGGQGNERSR